MVKKLAQERLVASRDGRMASAGFVRMCGSTSKSVGGAYEKGKRNRPQVCQDFGEENEASRRGTGLPMTLPIHDM